MKHLIKLIILSICSIALLACKGSLPEKNDSTDSRTFIKYSDLFTYKDHGNYRVLSIMDPMNTADTLYKYVLSGNVSKLPTNITGIKIQTPVNKVISLSSIYIGLMDRLNLTEKIIGVDNYNFVINKRVIENISKGKISEVGETKNLNIEKIIELEPDLIFTYGDGRGEKLYLNKLQESKIDVAVIVSHYETNPLARAEWIKFVAAFFNQEAKAVEFFNKTDSMYNSLKGLVPDTSTKPTVFTEAMYGGTWFAPGGKSFISNLINDAGGNYVFKTNNQRGSMRISFESMLQKAGKADIWINVLYWKTLNEITNADIRYSHFRAYKTGMIFNNNAVLNETGGNPYWEVGSANPEMILSDLIKIFHEGILNDVNYNFYHKLR